MVVNLSVTILNVYMADVKRLTQAADSSVYNGDLGQFVWSKLHALFSTCFGVRHQPLEERPSVSGKYQTLLAGGGGGGRGGRDGGGRQTHKRGLFLEGGVGTNCKYLSSLGSSTSLCGRRRM